MKNVGVTEVKDDIARKGVTDDMTSDREVWEKQTCCQVNWDGLGFGRGFTTT